MTHHPAHNSTSRRQFLGSAPLIGLGSLLLIDPALAQQDLVLKNSDSEAIAIDYHSDASAVNVSKFPKYANGQNCRNCNLYVEDKGAATGGCGIVFGKLVEAKGWCSSWESKPG